MNVMQDRGGVRDSGLMWGDEAPGLDAALAFDGIKADEVEGGLAVDSHNGIPAQRRKALSNSSGSISPNNDRRCRATRCRSPVASSGVDSRCAVSPRRSHL